MCVSWSGVLPGPYKSHSWQLPPVLAKKTRSYLGWGGCSCVLPPWCIGCSCQTLWKGYNYLCTNQCAWQLLCALELFCVVAIVCHFLLSIKVMRHLCYIEETDFNSIGQLPWSKPATMVQNTLLDPWVRTSSWRFKALKKIPLYPPCYKAHKWEGPSTRHRVMGVSIGSWSPIIWHW